MTRRTLADATATACILAIVRLRVFALLLALLVAVTPAIRLLCELDCETPTEKAVRCQHAAVAPDSERVRAADHGCAHGHGGIPALLTSARIRDLGVTSPGELPETPLRTLLPGPPTQPLTMRGPPGPGPRSTTALNTILRI